MNTQLVILINIFALSILFVIFTSIQYKSNNYIDHKLFLTLLILNALSIIIDSSSYFLIGKPGSVIREINYILSTIAYIMPAISLITWNLYARYQVYGDKKITDKILIPLIIPACINGALSILSRFNGYYFYFDKNNSYHRGKLFFFYTLMCVAYILYSQFFIIKMHRQITKKYFMPLAMFAVPPLIGGIIQALFNCISLVWICMTISLLVIYLNVQNDQLFTDHLTGLSNRRYLDRYLNEYLKREKKEDLLAGIMVDIDHFKSINDTWGHSTGDQALIYVAKILERSFKKDDLICRYGGDEFLIIFKIKNEKDLTEAINRLISSEKKYDEQILTPYQILLSIGYDIYNSGSGNNIEQFIKHIDSLMYENKKEKDAVLYLKQS